MDKIFCKNLNVHDYLKSARFEMNIADLFFVSRETLSIGLKKVQHPPYFSTTIDYFPSDDNLYHRHHKSPSERKKTTSIAIL